MLLRWTDTISPEFDCSDAVGLLCVGSCEQHSDYLPVGTDTLIGTRVSEEAARRAQARVYLLPVQTCGFSPHHRSFKGCITISQDSLLRYLVELCLCAFGNGIGTLIIVNSHGGNQSCLQNVVNELGAKHGHKAILVRYWDLIASEVSALRDSPEGGMGHAGEFETSLMMYLHPELVRPERFGERQPAIGSAYFSPDLFASNMVYSYVPFEAYSPLGNVGQPQFGSAAKGEMFFTLACESLARMIDHYARDPY